MRAFFVPTNPLVHVTITANEKPFFPLKSNEDSIKKKNKLSSLEFIRASVKARLFFDSMNNNGYLDNFQSWTFCISGIFIYLFIQTGNRPIDTREYIDMSISSSGVAHLFPKTVWRQLFRVFIYFLFCRPQVWSWLGLDNDVCLMYTDYHNKLDAIELSVLEIKKTS